MGEKLPARTAGQERFYRLESEMRDQARNDSSGESDSQHCFYVSKVRMGEPDHQAGNGQSDAKTGQMLVLGGEGEASGKQ